MYTYIFIYYTKYIHILYNIHKIIYIVLLSFITDEDIKSFLELFLLIEKDGKKVIEQNGQVFLSHETNFHLHTHVREKRSYFLTDLINYHEYLTPCTMSRTYMFASVKKIIGRKDKQRVITLLGLGNSLSTPVNYHLSIAVVCVYTSHPDRGHSTRTIKPAFAVFFTPSMSQPVSSSLASFTVTHHWSR